MKKLLPRMDAIQIAFTAVMTAFIAATTIVIRIPVAPTSGYINLGDAAVIISGILFGPYIGAFAGGVGSALADLYFGYAHWAPFTLIIKGIEGLIIGMAARRSNKKVILLLFSGIAGLEMVLGYFLVEIKLYGLPAAISELPGNSLQLIAAILGAIIAIIVKKRAPPKYTI